MSTTGFAKYSIKFMAKFFLGKKSFWQIFLATIYFWQNFFEIFFYKILTNVTVCFRLSQEPTFKVWSKSGQ